MKSKSAVEFLVETLAENGILHSSDIEKAKEMEKQQMWNYIESNYVNGENSLAFHKAEFEKYYNETFKQ
jgi:hypothetical protein